MPGPGHWFEPHPRGRLEHPWSLRAGTLRAQKPASLHFLRIVSCLLCLADFKTYFLLMFKFEVISCSVKVLCLKIVLKGFSK